MSEQDLNGLRALRLFQAREHDLRVRENAQKLDDERIARAKATHEVMVKARLDRGEQPEEPGEKP